VATFERELNIPVVAVARPEDAVRGADLVLAAARSRDETPILYGDWLSPGMTVVSIGSTLPEQREIDVSVVERCDLIVCDVVDEVAEETGDMIAAEAAGVEFRSKTISLNALMQGRDARAGSAMLPLFKSVGAGLQDLVVAELAFEKSLAQGLAAQLPIEFYNKR